MKLLNKEPEERPTAEQALSELDPEFDLDAEPGDFIGRSEPGKCCTMR